MDSSDALGIDVSLYQGSVDWTAVRSAGISFGIAKATEGLHLVDPFFAANWRGMQRAGLVRGAYHFFHPTLDAAEQADHFLQTVPLAPGDLPPVLDVEKGGESPEQVAAGVRTWLERVAAATGRPPLLYTAPGIWDEIATGDFSAYPLWVAQYAAAEQPRLPSGWSEWRLWQYSQSGQVRGVNGPVDLNRFQGSRSDLQAFAQPRAPRLILAQPRDRDWRYQAVPAEFRGGQFWVTSRVLATALGQPGGTDALHPVRAAVAELGWQATFATEHLRDAADPRVYAFVSTGG